MRKPPPISAFVDYPVSAGTALLAIGVTLAKFADRDISPLLEDARVMQGQLWRFVSSALPHGSPLHLIFNVYWVWVFGTLIEEMFGHARTFGLFVLLAAGSGAAEYALLEGGIGLSGVGYGLFGMLWALSRRDRRFFDAVDTNTITVFVAWFFICIVLTWAGTMPVANVAHGVGAGLGALVGLAVAAEPRRRRVLGALTGAAVAACVVLATIGRPWVNVSRHGAMYEAQMGYDALVANRTAEGVRWFERATRMRSATAGYWFNLGLGYARLGRHAEAAAAFARAYRMEPSDPRFKGAWEATRVGAQTAPSSKPATDESRVPEK